MARLSRSLTALSLVVATFAIASPALAQLENRNDYLRLSWRFEELLRARTAESKAAIQKGIDAERSAIHGEMEKVIAAQLKNEGANADNADLGTVLEKQRSIVSTLNEGIDAARADISLLEKEEEIYKAGGTPPEGLIMLTKTYPELLGKKAILEDRLDVLQAFLKPQNDRLNQLKSEQQLRNIGILMSILTYIGLILLVFWLERAIRNTILDRIRNRHLRYAATKTFTFIVYVSLIFWIVQKLFSEHPGILTVIALIGAALVIVTQDILKGLIGWTGLRGYLSLGQRVSIGSVTGDVVDSGLLYTTLQISRTDSMEEVGQVGKLVRIPNEKLLSQSMVNYHSTSDFENVELSVSIARSDQWEKAQKILERILEEETGSASQLAQRQTHQRMRGFAVHREPPASRLYMNLSPKREVEFHVCFPAPIGQRRAVATEVLKRILKQFQQEGIDMTPRD